MPQGLTTSTTDTIALPNFCPHCGWEVNKKYDVFCGGCACRLDCMTRPQGCGAACKRCGKTVVQTGDRQCAECGATQ